MVMKSLLFLSLYGYLVIANPVINETSSISPVNKLSLPFLAKLEKTPGKNYAYSPLSIATALGLLKEGADGWTLGKINQFFGNQDIAETVNKIAKKSANAVDSKLNSANLIIHRNDITLKDTYKTNVINKYKAAVESFDSGNIQATTDRVNNFISQNTLNLIPKMMDSIDPNTEFLLINAVSLDAKWKNPFEDQSKGNGMSPSRSTPFEVFHADTGDQNIEYMKDSNRWFDYHHSADKKFQLIRLHYKDGLEMVVLFPDDVKGLDSVLSNLTENELETAIGKLKLINAELEMPKFNVESTLNIISILSNLGLRDLFGTSANFTKMFPTSTRVNDAQHRAIVKVDEKGTKAVAATYFGGNRSLNSEIISLPIIRVDRPFLFVIREPSTRSHLFVGMMKKI